MKIIQFHPAMKNLNGSERLLIELNNYLIQKGNNTYIATNTFGKNIKEIINKKTKIVNSKINPIKEGPFSHFPQLISLTLTIFKLKKADAIISHAPGSLLASYIYRLFHKNSKYIYYCHEPPRGIYDLNKKSKHLSFFTKIAMLIFANTYKKIDKFLTSKQDTIITNSFYNKKIIDKIYSVDSKVIYPGVDLKKFQKINIRAKYKIGNKKIILTVGKLHHRKNHYLQIKLIKKLKEEGKLNKIQFIISGSGPEEKKLKKFAKELNVLKEIIFTGHISENELYSLYKEANIFLFTAHNEPFGIVIIEAISNGLYLLVPNQGGPFEICKNKNFCYIYEQDNLESLHNGIIKLLKTNNKFKLEEIKYANNFSWEKMSKKIFNEIKK